MSNDFRDYLPGPDWPRTAGVGELDAYSHAERSKERPSVQGLLARWRELYAQPFVGVTADGAVQPGLYALADEGAPTAVMVAAAHRVLALASDEERARLSHAVDAPEWRIWSNPEIYFHAVGLRLEEIGAPLREAILGVLRASMSRAGYAKARGCMKVNEFLGELVGAPRVMNEYSYNFSLFGAPSPTAPWGWSLYGHHLVLNCFVLGRQMVISPTFMGAEPNIIDVGPNAGLELFKDEERIGLDLMRSLDPAAQRQARVYDAMHDPAMPEGRYHFADQHHLGGAFQDNRVIPYEGVKAERFSAGQRQRLLDLVEAYVGYLPAGPLAARMAAIERHLDETRFCWIGRFGPDDPFYYRIQSPVLMIEFDHHAGVWLTNEQASKCHIHTVVRTPNGNDYGKDLLRLHYAQVHPGAKLAGH